MELKSNRYTSTLYHDIFDYKLTKKELIRWQYKENQPFIKGKIKISKNQLLRLKYSRKKLVMAKKVAKLIAKIPTIKFVGVTGALAMMNAGKNSDIDLLIITKNGYLWTSRLICYLAIWVFGFRTRKPKNKTEKDRLCLNMWLDESDLIWSIKDRNIYTSHEIAQIVPLVNKDKTFEKFLFLNKWVLNFWPKAVEIKNFTLKEVNEFKIKNHNLKRSLIETIAFKLQYFYMSKKITREVVTPTRAFFHPNDWGKIIFDKLYRN